MKTLYADGRPPTDHLPVLANDAAALTGRALVPIEHPEFAALTKSDQCAGVFIPNSVDVRELPAEALTADCIALHFPEFVQGQAYSQAKLLRTRLGFTGELRATGDVLLDQLQYMVDVGFDAFELASGQKQALVRDLLDAQRTHYLSTKTVRGVWNQRQDHA